MARHTVTSSILVRKIAVSIIWILRAVQRWPYCIFMQATSICPLIFSIMFFRERMRKLRNKAKTLLDDETSQENEENYARRLMQGDSGLSPSKQAGLACHSDYTQMWELRRSQPLLQPSGEPNTDGVPSQQSASTIAAPACCNKTTFITFKPREPIYERSRFSALLHKNLNGVPLYFEYEPGASGDRPASQGPGDNTYKRPDLITNSGRRASDASQASGAVPRTVKFRDDRRCAEGQRDMCDHCALHASSERILDEPSSPPAGDQSVQAVWSGQVALSDDDDAQALWGPRVFMGRHHHPEGSGQPRDKEGYIKLIVICNGPWSSGRCSCNVIRYLHTSWSQMEAAHRINVSLVAGTAIIAFMTTGENHSCLIPILLKRPCIRRLSCDSTVLGIVTLLFIQMWLKNCVGHFCLCNIQWIIYRKLKWITILHAFWATLFWATQFCLALTVLYSISFGTLLLKG